MNNIAISERWLKSRFLCSGPRWGLCLLLLLSTMVWGCKVRKAQSRPKVPLNKIKLPPGFQLSIFSQKVPGARSLARGSKGTIFVSTRQYGKVFALVDTNGDHKADKVYTIFQGGYMPNGVAFRNGSLYVAEVHRILRFDKIESRLANPPKPVVVYARLPRIASHGWKFIRFGPDGWLYIPLGAPCNVCLRKDKRFASILRMKPDGSKLEIYASGVRNSVGFDWHPTTKQLWFTDNGRDMLGDNLPPCELNHAPRKGLHFGFPFCHGGFLSDPLFGKQRTCKEFRAPAQNLGPHVAPLGMRFYTGSMFPKSYKHQIFIAEHGSWNRTVPIGYRITLVTLNKQSKTTSYTVFASGWLQEVKQGGRVKYKRLGRPVDVMNMPDGSMLISDDYAGVVYRLSYKKK